MNKQGFQKGHGYLKKPGFKHSEASKLKNRIAHLGKTPWNKGKIGVMPVGEAHHSWRGGLPNCIDCGKQISVKTYIRCRTCSNKQRVGENNSNFRGGYENKLMHNRKRRILKLKAGGSHTLAQWEQLKAKYQHICLQPLCQVCNSRKFTAQIDFRIKFEEQYHD